MISPKLRRILRPRWSTARTRRRSITTSPVLTWPARIAPLPWPVPARRSLPIPHIPAHVSCWRSSTALGADRARHPDCISTLRTRNNRLAEGPMKVTVLGYLAKEGGELADVVVEQVAAALRRAGHRVN